MSRGEPETKSLSEMFGSIAENYEFLNITISSGQFDFVTVAFGLRNIEKLEKTLEEMQRVLKPGGVAASLDLGKPRNKFLRNLYGFYFHRIMLHLAGFITGNKKPYKHLSNSLKNFPTKNLYKIF